MHEDTRNTIRQEIDAIHSASVEYWNKARNRAAKPERNTNCDKIDWIQSGHRISFATMTIAIENDAKTAQKTKRITRLQSLRCRTSERMRP